MLAEKLRVSVQRSPAQSESIPKTRPKGVVDGKQVNIPVLVHTKKVTESCSLYERSEMFVEVSLFKRAE